MHLCSILIIFLTSSVSWCQCDSDPSYVPLNSLTIKDLFKRNNSNDGDLPETSWWNNLQLSRRKSNRIPSYRIASKKKEEHLRKLREVIDTFLNRVEQEEDSVRQKVNVDKFKTVLVNILYPLTLNAYEFNEDQVLRIFMRKVLQDEGEDVLISPNIPFKRQKILMEAVTRALESRPDLFSSQENIPTTFHYPQLATSRNESVPESLSVSTGSSVQNFKIFSASKKPLTFDEDKISKVHEIITSTTPKIKYNFFALMPERTSNEGIQTSTRTTTTIRPVSSITPPNYKVIFNNYKRVKGVAFEDLLKKTTTTTMKPLENPLEPVSTEKQEENTIETEEHIGLKKDKSLDALKMHGQFELISPFLFKKPIPSSAQFFRREINKIQSPSEQSLNITNAFLQKSPFMQVSRPKPQDDSYIKIEVLESPFLQSYFDSKENGNVLETRIQTVPDVIKPFDPQNIQAKFDRDHLSNLVKDFNYSKAKSSQPRLPFRNSSRVYPRLSSSHLGRVSSVIHSGDSVSDEQQSKTTSDLRPIESDLQKSIVTHRSETIPHKEHEEQDDFRDSFISQLKKTLEVSTHGSLDNRFSVDVPGTSSPQSEENTSRQVQIRQSALPEPASNLQRRTSSLSTTRSPFQRQADIPSSTQFGPLENRRFGNTNSGELNSREIGRLRVPSIIASLFRQRLDPAMPPLAHAVTSNGPIEVPGPLRTHSGLIDYLRDQSNNRASKPVTTIRTTTTTTSTTENPLVQILKNANLRPRRTTTTTPRPVRATSRRESVIPRSRNVYVSSRRSDSSDDDDQRSWTETPSSFKQLELQNKFLKTLLKSALKMHTSKSVSTNDQMTTSASSPASSILRNPFQERFKIPPKILPLRSKSRADNEQNFTILKPQSLPDPPLLRKKQRRVRQRNAFYG